jgi:formate-dependent nitrite reductase membrane component NrfD
MEESPKKEIPQEVRDEIIDAEQLRLLSIGHHIVGGLAVAFSSLFIFHFMFIFSMSMHPQMFPGASAQQKPPEGVMQVFAVGLGMFILAGWIYGALVIYAGRCVKRRVARNFTMVMACLNTLMVPFGTVLGVFTLLVLSRQTVKRLYQ